MSDNGSTPNLLGLVMVTAVLALGVWVVTEFPIDVETEFPPESCLRPQPKLSPSYELCNATNVYFRNLSHGATGGQGPEALYQALVARLRGAGDRYMVAYMTATRAAALLDTPEFEAARPPAEETLALMTGETRSGAAIIRAYGRAILGGIAVHQGDLDMAATLFRDLNAKAPISESTPGRTMIAGTLGLRAEFALATGDSDKAYAAAGQAAGHYLAIGQPRLASLLHSRLAEQAIAEDQIVAREMMARSVRYACDEADDAAYCAFARNARDTFHGRLAQITAE